MENKEISGERIEKKILTEFTELQYKDNPCKLWFAPSLSWNRPISEQRER